MVFLSFFKIFQELRQMTLTFSEMQNDDNFFGMKYQVYWLVKKSCFDDGKYRHLGLQHFKQETPTTAFACKICESFKNTFFTEYLRWLIFKTSNSNNLFKYLSAIFLTHNKSLITCDSHNDKITQKCIHLPKICSHTAFL